MSERGARSDLHVADLLPEERDRAAQLQERADARARREHLLALHEVRAVALLVHAAHVEPRACTSNTETTTMYSHLLDSMYEYWNIERVYLYSYTVGLPTYNSCTRT